MIRFGSTTRTPPLFFCSQAVKSAPGTVCKTHRSACQIDQFGQSIQLQFWRCQPITICCLGLFTSHKHASSLFFFVDTTGQCMKEVVETGHSSFGAVRMNECGGCTFLRSNSRWCGSEFHENVMNKGNTHTTKFSSAMLSNAGCQVFPVVSCPKVLMPLLFSIGIHGFSERVATHLEDGEREIQFDVMPPNLSAACCVTPGRGFEPRAKKRHQLATLPMRLGRWHSAVRCAFAAFWV